ncbi:hypothetical protein LOK49_LG07G00860 [Camellia lanceoleosa]|uniref:Uncharacterized protein n=1 Tax=Camellia lanceoleosa TaxID=1840588 RepID=A0ACC0H0M4_9ERIC|nr:hypothetical protein LOK49_LG07G00860 [Camellia lanceoleosa]
MVLMFVWCVLRGLLATKWKIKLVKLGHTALVASTSQFALGLPQLVFFLASPCIRNPPKHELVDQPPTSYSLLLPEVMNVNWGRITEQNCYLVDWILLRIVQGVAGLQLKNGSNMFQGPF